MVYNSVEIFEGYSGRPGEDISLIFLPYELSFSNSNYPVQGRGLYQVCIVSYGCDAAGWNVHKFHETACHAAVDAFRSIDV